MKVIYWKDPGASVEIVKCVNAGDHFIVIVEGLIAKAFVSAVGVGIVALTAVEASVLIGMLAIAAVAALAFYALAKGYKVRGKARTPDGTEYEIVFEPRAKGGDAA
jgi:hypothetical protein